MHPPRSHAIYSLGNQFSPERPDFINRTIDEKPKLRPALPNYFIIGPFDLLRLHTCSVNLRQQFLQRNE